MALMGRIQMRVGEMGMTPRFRAGDVVRTFRWAYKRQWEGKILAISLDGQAIAAVDLTITLGPEYPAGSHVVRAVTPDEIYLLQRAGDGGGLKR